ncbi:Odorant receptor 169 [Nylanderia fulva]|uniref:Odorant receptor n=1 Tax=Nylanderia fulva TaxID=613905 RepID=A0A6G1LQI0_9HYME|nr:Odorant receptor 169 [Nylanderia fulva]
MDMSESSGYQDFMWAIKINRLSLELVGLWPKTDEVAKRRLGSDIRTGFAFIMIAIVSGIPYIHALIRVWGNMALMIDNLRVTIPVITISLELVIMRWKQTVVLTIVETMAEDWTATKLSTERDVMIKQARIARLLIIFGYIIVATSFTILIILPCFGVQIRYPTNLTDRNKLLPLQTYYIYDTDKDLLYVLTFLSQAIGILMSAIIFIAINAFLGFVILHICGQLENFKQRIIKLVSCEDFNKALSSSIVTHLRLIRYADNIENTYTLILFLLVLQFGIVFCLCGFIILIVISDEKLTAANFSQISYLLSSVICLLSQTFFYCFGGDLITEQCNAVYQTICDLEWYTLEPRKARNLILLMLVAKEPFRITAGKVLPLKMTTFCSLLKTTAGYISVLLAMRN